MEIKTFNRWSLADVTVSDQGLIKYLNLDPRYVPKTGSRYAKDRFHKSKVFIVERLINKLMIPGHKAKKHKMSSGHCTGKAQTAYDIVEQALGKIEARTKTNPIQVLVKAIENAAPREEIITIEYGGARYPKAVECAPQRRIDYALRQMVQGVYAKCFNKKKSVVDALTDEILAAHSLSPTSAAIAKKVEVERQADASR